MTIGYLRDNLLQGAYSKELILKAEIFVVKKLNFEISSNNSFFFSQYFEILISKHLSVICMKLLRYTIMLIMKKAVLLIEFHFNLNPVEEAMIIINLSFLILNQLNLFKIAEYSEMFFELSNLTSNLELCSFPEYTSLLLSSLKLETELIKSLYEFKAINNL